MANPTQSRLRELFDFDAESGVLIWRVRTAEDFANISYCERWNARYAGTVAGGINGNGYRLVGIDGKRWKAHRLIWVCANGPIPAGMQIDHINGVRDDNRIENLRLVTTAENNRNSSMPRDNTSGVMGVYWHKSHGKWVSLIRVDGQLKHLGHFDTIAAAADARANAEREFGFHPGHGKAASFAPATISGPGGAS